MLCDMQCDFGPHSDLLGPVPRVLARGRARDTGPPKGGSDRTAAHASCSGALQQVTELDGTSSLGPLVGRWHLESPCTWVQLLLLRMRSGCAQVLPLQVGLRDTRVSCFFAFCIQKADRVNAYIAHHNSEVRSAFSLGN